MHVLQGSHFIPLMKFSFPVFLLFFPDFFQAQKCVYHLKIIKLSNHAKNCVEITKILPFPQYSLMTDTFSQCEINFEEQECIPVGCVPAAHRPYAAVFFRGGGSPWQGGSAWSRGGLSAWLGGVCLVRGVLPAEGGLPGGSLQTLPCTESQTCVKT